MAADKGSEVAQVGLGIMYANGQGVPQVYEEAIKWYRLAAAQGNVGAQNNLGVMYSQGRGVPRNSTIAMMWFVIASTSPEGGLARQNRDRLNRTINSGNRVVQELVARCRASKFRNCGGMAAPP